MPIKSINFKIKISGEGRKKNPEPKTSVNAEKKVVSNTQNIKKGNTRRPAGRSTNTDNQQGQIAPVNNRKNTPPTQISRNLSDKTSKINQGTKKLNKKSTLENLKKIISGNKKQSTIRSAKNKQQVVVSNTSVNINTFNKKNAKLEKFK